MCGYVRKKILKNLLFIKPEKQYTGLGSDFLRRIESTMKEAGINAIFLQGNSRYLFSAVNKTREGLIWILEQWQRLYSRK